MTTNDVFLIYFSIFSYLLQLGALVASGTEYGTLLHCQRNFFLSFFKVTLATDKPVTWPSGTYSPKLKELNLKFVKLIA